jgi:hypothetical protein
LSTNNEKNKDSPSKEQRLAQQVALTKLKGPATSRVSVRNPRILIFMIREMSKTNSNE